VQIASTIEFCRGRLALVAALVAAVVGAADRESAAIRAAELELRVPEDATAARLPVRYPGACRTEVEFFEHKLQSVAFNIFDPHGRVRATLLMQGNRHTGTSWNQYDADGQVVREGWHFLDSGSSVSSFRYDRAGHKVEELHDLDADGRPDELSINVYDRDGRLVTRRSHVDPQDRTGGDRTTYAYDGGRLVFERLYSDDGRPAFYVRYKHNDRGLVVEEESHWYPTEARQHEPRFVHRFTYDAEDRMLFKHVIGGAGLTFAYRYDEAGNPTSYETRRADGTVTCRETYHYDCW